MKPTRTAILWFCLALSSTGTLHAEPLDTPTSAQRPSTEARAERDRLYARLGVLIAEQALAQARDHVDDARALSESGVGPDSVAAEVYAELAAAEQRLASAHLAQREAARGEPTSRALPRPADDVRRLARMNAGVDARDVTTRDAVSKLAAAEREYRAQRRAFRELRATSVQRLLAEKALSDARWHVLAAHFAQVP